VVFGHFSRISSFSSYLCIFGLVAKEAPPSGEIFFQLKARPRIPVDGLLTLPLSATFPKLFANFQPLLH
jgi:hypothetical protein